MRGRRTDPPPPAPRKRGAPRAFPWVPAAVLLSLAVPVLCVYWQVGTHDFINFDDNIYVYDNPVVLRGVTLEGFRRAFTTFDDANWLPLTWFSHMLDVELVGPDPGWHHRVNVLLHLLNTEFLFLVLWQMTGELWPSAFVAALFGVHPLHVESVAWVAERKNVLSTLFWILTTGAYLRYVRRPGFGRFAVVAATFAMGLMAKPMLVTLPFALLLLDFWPLGRIRPPGSGRLPSWRPPVPAAAHPLREKAPLLLLSAASSVTTYLAQTRMSLVTSFDVVPVASRIANMFVAYAAYLRKTVWPSGLAVFYPHPSIAGDGIPAWEVAASILLLCGLSTVALLQHRRRPYLAAGWLWYLGTLVPVIGLVQVGSQAHADRYAYVPLVGIFVAIAWGIPSILPERRFRRIALGALAGAVLVALSAAARIQAGYWRDGVTLFSRAVAVTDRNWFALDGLGTSYSELGRHEVAIGYYRESLRIAPYYANAWNNLGMAFFSLGQHRQAIGYYREALRIDPGSAGLWNNLGRSYAGLGRHGEAADCFREALRLRPDFLEAGKNLSAVAALPGK